MRKYVSAVRISIHHGIRPRKRVGGGPLERSYVPPTELRVLRGLTRYRVRLVEHQSAVACRIQKLLERCNIKLPSVASDILGVRYGLRCMASADGWCPESRATHAPADVGGSTFPDVRHALLATIKKVGPSHIPVFYSMTRQSRVPERRASAAAHGTVWSSRLPLIGRGPVQFR